MPGDSLKEGQDYTIEDGLLVFTRDYHLKRGYCCGSGCRNCPYPSLRVVSLVPSWTETLLWAGCQVVGRTRFCLHPQLKVKSIPAIGGTKEADFEKLAALAPDLLILDREENPKVMSEKAPCAWFASDVHSAQDLPRELKKLAALFASSRRGPRDEKVAKNLNCLASRWEKVLSASPQTLRSWHDLPGVIEWITEPPHEVSASRTAYVIWQKPWMLAGSDTFISSMLGLAGAPSMVAVEGKYPEVALETLPENTVFLFSSEPYPFARELKRLRELGRPAALVDGEAFSWFGLRSLEFLEHQR